MEMFKKPVIGIDLGTANGLVFVKGKGIVVNEPTIVSIDRETNKVIAVGNAAKTRAGKSKSSYVIRPVQKGIIADFDTTKRLLQFFYQKSLKNKMKLNKPTVLISVPCNITDVEKMALVEAGMEAGAKTVELIEEPLAAAIGIGIDVDASVAHAVIDIGGGTTDVAFVALGEIVKSISIKVAGDNFTESIKNHLRQTYRIDIGAQENERLKLNKAIVYKEVGEALSEPEEVKGIDILSGLPKAIKIRDEDIIDALQNDIDVIVKGIKALLSEVSPEMVADILNEGIYVTGGGARIRGIKEFFEKEFNTKVFIVEDNLNSVVLGLGKMLNSIE